MKCPYQEVMEEEQTVNILHRLQKQNVSRLKVVDQLKNGHR